jgi:hypothetical protein
LNRSLTQQRRELDRKWQADFGELQTKKTQLQQYEERLIEQVRKEQSFLAGKADCFFGNWF